jgi:hypothetical protein
MEMKRMKKKGIFFTLIALLMVSLFLFYFATESRIKIGERMPATKSRVHSVNDFVESLETIYLPRALYTTSQRALHSIIIEMNESTRFRDDLNDDLFNATITGNITNITNPSKTVELPLMLNNTLIDWVDKLTNTSRNILHIDLELTVNDVRINQTNNTGPWFAEVTMDVNYTVNSSGVAFWTRRTNVTTRFSVEGFIDPYYMLMTQTDTDLVDYNATNNARVIKRTPYVEDENWNATLINDTIKQETYFSIDHSPSITSIAPSFLMRFEGDMDQSECCGIATLINPNKLLEDTSYGSGNAGKLQERSFVDFEFWTRRYCFDENRGEDFRLFNISGVSTEQPDEEFSFFRLDNYHANILFASPDAGFPLEENDEYVECWS